MTNPELHQEIPPSLEHLPSDEKISEGLVFDSPITNAVLESLADRVDESFEQLRADESDEYGSCLAYTLGKLHLAEDEAVDRVLANTAMSQNHGMVTLFYKDISTEEQTIWRGENESSQFMLIKSIGSIAMKDGTHREATVYAILGTKHEVEK